ncbi:3-keto-5-aminohexanoate cleavage protein [Streptomyces tanashiensis]|uniref:3-keto-5-aminohexanoate cleavage protein n=1 Tax=Streptomyces tanashiensis TaxID=67367 RepID=A0ABY6R9E0_9ACTN|nr:3-keto-5-aminohexanoate cleavage protein [Streptomyces tanashiensis]UZX26685.1 3-keto-5-aminohexanoate cleavage protein [Streptomyces tanashiensis]
MLQVCLNGARGPGDSAVVPMSPESLAESAARAVAAGAGEVRVHPRTPCGRTSLSPRVLTPVLAELRPAVSAVAGAPVPVTTVASAEPEPGRRVERIRSWTVLPDLVSVDWHEPGAEAVVAALLERGVGVEAALWSGTDGPERFAGSPPAPGVRRVLVRVTAAGPDGDPEAAARALIATLAVQPGLPVPAHAPPAPPHGLPVQVHGLPVQVHGLPVLLHGEEDGAWPVLRLARRLGAGARIGLEDTLLLPDGTPARSNAELVTAALAYGRTGF